MSKLIFLDFDGVLNSHQYLYVTPKPWGDLEMEGNEHLMLDPVAVDRLNQIIEQTGAHVVVSSSWRHGHDRERLQEILEARGFMGDVIDVTPDDSRLDRGDEIALWLRDHPEVERYVVLDDDADDTETMRKHLIKTSFYTGLLDCHVSEAIRRLNR